MDKMTRETDLSRAVFYTVSGGILTAAFGVLGAGMAQAAPADKATPANEMAAIKKAGQPNKAAVPAKSANGQQPTQKKPVEKSAGRLTQERMERNYGAPAKGDKTNSEWQAEKDKNKKAERSERADEASKNPGRARQRQMEDNYGSPSKGDKADADRQLTAHNEKAAGEARRKADILNQEALRDTLGPTRGFEKRVDAAAAAEREAQRLEDVRDRGVAPPPATVGYRVSSKGGSKGGGATYTAAVDVDQWGRMTGEDGKGIQVGVTKDGKIVALSEKELTGSTAKKLRTSWMTETGRTPDGKIVTIYHPKDQFQKNFEDLGIQWQQVTKNGEVQWGELGEAAGGTAALTADAVLSFGQGNVYGTSKSCVSKGEGCGEAAKEVGLAGVSALPFVGKPASAGARALAGATKVAAGKVLPTAVTELPSGVRAAIAGAAATAGRTVAETPWVARPAAAVRQGATTASQGVARIPGVRPVVAAAAPAVRNALPAISNAIHTGTRVPQVRYPLYEHTADNALDEARRIKDCAKGGDCGSAVTGAGTLAFDVLKGRGLTNLHDHAPGCVEGQAGDCALGALDTLAVKVVRPQPAGTFTVDPVRPAPDGVKPVLLSTPGSDSGAAIKAVRALRESGVPRRRNVAAAEVAIEGHSVYVLTSVSGQTARAGSVPPVDVTANLQRFVPQRFAGENTRFNETEFKLLNFIANQLGQSSPLVRGRINLHTEKAVCGSCASIIAQFEREFPGIRVYVTEGR
ncbi:deaminase domain-containing protein [Amycolatopsis sp. cmx-4-54]|uniref:deaminase domain-containing protein n=1 Tax=Amycolatopsis sp. cmx-4-54 TaxID=2790936 RepID=UPI0039787F81